MSYTLRFTDRPGGTVLLDVSPGSGGVQTGEPGPSFPPPPVNRRTFDNPVADGGSIPSSAFGLRTCKLPLVYTPGSVDPLMVGQVRTNTFRNPEMSINATWWTALLQTGGTVTNTRQTSGGPVVDGRTLNFFRMTVATVTTGALPATGIVFGNPGADIITCVGSKPLNIKLLARCSVTDRTSQIVVTWHDGTGAQIGAINGPVTAIGGSGWTLLEFTPTAPAGATRAYVRIYSVGGAAWPVGATLDATAVLTEVVDLPTTSRPYFSGDSTDNATANAAWVGTVGDSASTLTYLDTRAARRVAVQSLMRVLQRERVWLELVAYDNAQVRYLHCYRSADAETLARLLGLGDTWAELTVTLLADPFAYGPKEDLGTLSFAQASRSKATISGATIKGDVPAPLECEFTSAGDSLAYSVYVATKRGGGVHSTYVDITTGGGTPPAGTTRTTVADAFNDYGGSHLLWDSVDEGQTIHMATAAVVSNAGVGDVKLRGTYRIVFLGHSDGGTWSDVWEADLRLVTPPTWVFASEQVKVASLTSITAQSNLFGTDTWVDMGLVEVPFAGRPLAAGFDADVAVEPLELQLHLTAREITTGPGSYGADAFIVLPADDELMVLSYADNGDARTFTVDPHSGQVVVREAGGLNVPDVARVGYQGAPPMVVPGEDVDVYSVRLQGGLGAQHLKTKAVYDTSWDASYWPRYLQVV